MTRRLADGVNENVFTEVLERDVARLAGRRSDTAPLDESDSHLRLARHVAAEVERALRALPADARVEEQVALVNDLLAFLRERAAAVAPGADVVRPGRLLTAAYPVDRPRRPVSPLGVSTLLTRNRAEPALGHELAAEIASADRIDALVSFVTMLPALTAHADAGRRVRLVTTTYTDATDVEAVDAVARLRDARVKVSFDGRRTRLHAKAWLFHGERHLPGRRAARQGPRPERCSQNGLEP